MSTAAGFDVRDLGTIPYRDALALQHELREQRIGDAIGDTLLVLEHPPVYTRGRRSAPGELTLPAQWYADRGIEIVDVDRGGKVTYHGPGQLVIYLICKVTDVKAFVCRLESAMVAALAGEGIDARGRSTEGIEYTGAWVGPRKIGSIGLRVTHGVTTHGLALNVDCDLEPFTWIVPCGLGDVEMTSIAQELPEGRTADLPRVRDRLLAALTPVRG